MRRALDDSVIVHLVHEVTDLAERRCRELGGQPGDLLRVLAVSWLSTEGALREASCGREQAQAEMDALFEVRVGQLLDAINRHAWARGALPGADVPDKGHA